MSVSLHSIWKMVPSTASELIRPSWLPVVMDELTLAARVHTRVLEMVTLWFPVQVFLCKIRNSFSSTLLVFTALDASSPRVSDVFLTCLCDLTRFDNRFSW